MSTVPDTSHNDVTAKYYEHLDPSDLADHFEVPVKPINPFHSHIPLADHFAYVNYDHSLHLISHLDNVLADFQFELTLCYGLYGRQCVYFYGNDSLLALYDQSDFLKMHFHNAWLLGKSEVTVILILHHFHPCFCIFWFIFSPRPLPQQ